MGFSSLLAHEENGVPREEAPVLAGLILEESTRMAYLVDNLLVSARAEAGALVVRRERVEVERVARRVFASLPEPGRQRVKLKTVPAAVKADADRLAQLIRNLVVNALQHGGARIELEVQLRADTVAVVVADDGNALPHAATTDLFEPYRGRRLLGQPGSLGLGLSVARTLARLMEGDLVYRREEGWTVFELTLPAA